MYKCLVTTSPVSTSPISTPTTEKHKYQTLPLQSCSHHHTLLPYAHFNNHTILPIISFGHFLRDFSIKILSAFPPCIQTTCSNRHHPLYFTNIRARVHKFSKNLNRNLKIRGTRQVTRSKSTLRTHIY